MRKLILAGVLLGGLPAAAAAQDADPTRIRITPGDARLDPIIGTAVSRDGQTLSMVPAGGSDTVTYSMASIERVEASAGRHSQAGRGLVVGGLVGAGIGGALAIAAAANAEALDSPGWMPVAVFGGGTVLGALVGAAIGAVSRGERWAATPSVTANRAAGGMNLGVQMPIRLGGAP